MSVVMTVSEPMPGNLAVLDNDEPTPSTKMRLQAGDVQLPCHSPRFPAALQTWSPRSHWRQAVGDTPADSQHPAQVFLSLLVLVFTDLDLNVLTDFSLFGILIDDLVEAITC